MSKKKYPGKSKKGSKAKAGSNRKKNIALLAFKVFAALFATGLVFVSLVYAGLFGKLPDYQTIKNIRNNTASAVYSSDGQMIGKYYVQNRLTINNENISQHVKNALVATEDSRFFEHKGLDIISIGRVFLKSIVMHDTRQGGGSTISQQLAKNLFPRRDYGILSFPVNKTREIFIAARLEKQFTKEEIIGLYLNTVPFGEDIYGIEVAANRFFGKASSHLTPPEAATLVGMLAANTSYNPRLYPDRSMQRRNIVLDRMQAQGFLSEEESEKYKTIPIKTSYSRLDSNNGPAPWFLEQVRIQTEAILSELPEQKYNIYTDGLKIRTTLDSRLQSYAVSAVKAHLSYLQKSFDEEWKGREPWDANPDIFYSALRATDRYKALKTKGMDDPAILAELEKPVKIEVYSAEGGNLRDMSPADSLRQSLRTLHTGFLAINPQTGHVLSWVGGVDFKFFKYDHVTARRQVGSTFKPILYATALNQGFDPCEFISNEQRVYERFDNWQPANSDGNHLGYYSFKGGLIHSANTIAAQIIDRTGVSSVIETARKMGISSNIPSVPSIALGTADISLLEMVGAYTAFPNYGRAVGPVIILSIETAGGELIYKAGETRFHNEAYNEESARIIIQMLREVIERGTGHALYSRYNLQGDYGGKTGTTQNNADGWFIGFTPDIVAGAWVGAENPGIRFQSTSLGQGAHTALPIFARFMQQTEKSSQHKYIAANRFYPLPEELQNKLNCEDYLEDYRPREEMGFFERLFGSPERQKPRAEAEKDSLLEERNRKVLQRMRDIFRKREE